MMLRRLALLFVVLAVLPAEAQMTGQRQTCTLRIQVMWATGGNAPGGLRVRLNRGLMGVAEALTNSSGSAEFAEVGPGEYQAVVSGEGIETAESSTIEVSGLSVFLTQTVAVRTSSSSDSKSSGRPSVAAEDLNIPPKAAKEYDRGNGEMAHQNWDKAVDHFNKAIEIYPKFYPAYNNLSVCYDKLGQRDKQRETLGKAISLDDHRAPALVNLGYVEFEDKNYAAASTDLNKALAIDPNIVQALFYLAEVDVESGQYAQAIALTRKAHSLPHQDYAIVHYTAARAYEREGHIADAIAELQTFLQEAPQSPRAAMARKAIAAMQTEQHQ